MCITTSSAEMSQTKILSISLDNGNNFIAYSNKVVDLSGKTNSMILPVFGKTNQTLFYDTTKYSKFLNQIVKKADLDNYLGMKARSASLSKSLTLEEFNLGKYTIGISESFNEVEEFLARHGVEINSELRLFFIDSYANCSFVVCVFNGDMESQPIAFEYEPINKDIIFFPTMDAHTGGAPKLTEKVDMSHTLVYEHTGVVEGKLYMDSVELNLPDMPNFLNKRRYRTLELNGSFNNGDIFIKKSDVAAIPFTETPVYTKL